MWRDRYDPMDLLALVPALRLAMEPIVAQLDQLLEEDGLVQRVKADLLRRAPHTATRGRPSTPVAEILRLLVVKRLYRWRDEETEHCVADSLVLRQCCRLSRASVPDDPTRLRWANLIGPQTLEALNERVVALARSLKVTRGRKLRVDSLVVETHIHHPTDSRLVGDGVRVWSRWRRRAKRVLRASVPLPQRLFRSRTRRVRRLAQQIHRLARRTRAEAAGATDDGPLVALPAVGAPGHWPSASAGAGGDPGAGGGEAAEPVRAAYPGHPTPQARQAGGGWPQRVAERSGRGPHQ